MNAETTNLIKQILAGAGERGFTMADILTDPRALAVKLMREDVCYTLRNLVAAEVVRQFQPEESQAEVAWRYALRDPLFEFAENSPRHSAATAGATQPEAAS